jgi:hypothetical protein
MALEVTGPLSYIHHIPGRIRVRCAALKNPTVADSLKSELMSRAGVTSVSTSLVTGSIVAHYDRLQMDGSELLATIRSAAPISNHVENFAAPRTPGQQRISPVLQRAVNTAAKAAAVYLVKTAIERSVVGLIAAVL